ncbi:RING finger and CHY zinc finger domain-containing protein 1 [Microtus ochrogaster]|uniref:RING finger and CHY zinc finger domain-containing protein 1 n=1 Tax=Microtus ochrogaster TaxID=79684 RepID=A0A8J6GB99_MICOH|nr:RING finger and CHY zinc finger domain-containing protein 1 [Microtus ochrogaster]
MAATAREDGVISLERGRRGCEHYDRGCLLKAPCCDKLYTCRLCHDNNEDHQLDRFQVKEVQCINCERLQHCIENVSRQNCPICLEDIHTSRVVAHVLPCGHLLHRGYRCPLCMHSALDMTRYWRQLDNEVAQTPMPSEYQNMSVEILCNDCNGRSTVQFHILGMKCKICESYNTAQAGGRRAAVDQQ